MNSDNHLVLLWMENVSKTIINNGGRVDLLKNVSFKIMQDEFVAMEGLAGLAKSALQKLLCGLEKPAQGKVIFDYEDTSQSSEEALKDFRRKKIGFVFDQGHLFDELSIYDNISMSCKYAGMSGNVGVSIRQAAERTGLQRPLEQQVRYLDALDRKRVEIARALINKPLLLIVDEPANSLNLKETELLLQLLVEIGAAGTTIILFSDDRDLTEVSSRIITFSKGSIISDRKKEVVLHCTS